MGSDKEADGLFRPEQKVNLSLYLAAYLEAVVYGEEKIIFLALAPRRQLHERFLR